MDSHNMHSIHKRVSFPRLVYIHNNTSLNYILNCASNNKVGAKLPARLLLYWQDKNDNFHKYLLSYFAQIPSAQANALSITLSIS